MDRNQLLNLVRECCPELGWDDKYPDLFGKFGTTIGGICVGWQWFEKDNITDAAKANGHQPITSATKEELLEMLVMVDHYRLNQYKEWYKKSKEKSSKLDEFIGKCERDYFGYDKDGYTDKTINRIFNSVYEALDETLLK